MTMPLFVGNPAVLVVSPHRDDRRVLFDWLDDHECEAIYTAKDIGQAVRLLDQEPEPGWCVVADQSALGSRVIQRLERLVVEFRDIDSNQLKQVAHGEHIAVSRSSRRGDRSGSSW